MLHHQVHGHSNSALVLLHGFCENNTCFDKQVLLFKDHCKVIVPDLPGFGLSNSFSQLSIADMAHEVNQLLDHLGVETCSLIGHSMGGYVALSFAHLFPSKTKGLGLVHSTAYADTPERKAKRDQIAHFISNEGKEKFIADFIPGLFTPDNQSESYVQTCIQNGLNGPQQGILAATLAMRDRPDYRDWLAQTDIPVFFGIGKHDALIPMETMLQQAATCQKASVCLLPLSARMSMYEEPELLANAIMQFMHDFDLIAN